MTALLRTLMALVAVVVATGCGSTVCDRSAQVDLSKKLGDCGPLLPASLLGDKATCSSRVSSCSDADQKALTRAIDCLDGLQVCSQASREVWESSRQFCFDPLASLSPACIAALFEGNTPGQDAGPDGGEVDAGPPALTDGGHGLQLVGVADERSFAFAWTKNQPGDIASYVLFAGADGGRVAEYAITPGTQLHFTSGSDAGAELGFHLAGFNSDGTLAFGNQDAGGGDDAGTGGCAGPLDCPTDRVCSLAQCRFQSCQPGGVVTCPLGYVCFPNGTCNRQISDGGTFDAGVARPDAGRPERPLPYVSNPLSLALHAPMFSADVAVGGFPGRRQDMVAIDTARVFVAMEQEGQIIGHQSSLRGYDFPDDVSTAFAIDTVGSRVHVTYNPESRLLYACYNVGRGVRVRRSADFGRTWGTLAADIEPDADAGLSSIVQDCDIAPWRNGGALLVTVDDDALAVRTVSNALSLSAPDYAFLSSGPDAGNIYAPTRPALATLVSDSIVHVTFTATRTIAGTGVSDTEPYGVYRDGTTGGFQQPQFLSNTGVGTPGTGLPQDFTDVAIDPVTKKALAAYTSLAPLPQGGSVHSTVYVALWNPTGRVWGTGADLNAFALDIDGNTTLLFPQKLRNDRWDAFSPRLAVNAAGQVFLSMVVGPKPTFAGDFRLYAVPFDFDVVSPVSTAKGWFVRPVIQVSPLRVVDPRVSGAPPPTLTGFAADSQISFGSTFVEGLGQDGEVEGRVIYNVRP